MGGRIRLIAGRRGVLTRQKFHMCLQLADLPRPDRKTDQALYGAYYTKDCFKCAELRGQPAHGGALRYGDFLDSLKYDTSYRNHLMAQWRQLLGESTAYMVNGTARSPALLSTECSLEVTRSLSPRTPEDHLD